MHSQSNSMNNIFNEFVSTKKNIYIQLVGRWCSQ